MMFEVLLEALAVVGVANGCKEDWVDEHTVGEWADKGSGKASGHDASVAVVGIVEVAAAAGGPLVRVGMLLVVLVAGMAWRVMEKRQAHFGTLLILCRVCIWVLGVCVSRVDGCRCAWLVASCRWLKDSEARWMERKGGS